MGNTNKEKIPQFFPNVLREARMNVSSTHPLLDRAKQRRIKIGIILPLSGNPEGMPEWLGIPYEIVAKTANAVDAPKSLVELDGVNVSIFATPKSSSAAVALESCTLRAFIIRRAGKEKKSGELSDVDLYFDIYTNGWVPKMWEWIGDNLSSTFFLAFTGSQMTLSFGKPEKKPDEEGSELAPVGKPTIVKKTAAKKATKKK